MPASALSLRLDLRRADHLRPFLGLFRNELAEIGRGTAEGCAAELFKLRLDIGIAEDGIDLTLSLVGIRNTIEAVAA
jgi:hypothetical protein